MRLEDKIRLICRIEFKLRFRHNIARRLKWITLGFELKRRGKYWAWGEEKSGFELTSKTVDFTSVYR